MDSLAERLAQGQVIILDGATGTELQHRGVPMNDVAWSAAALITHPDTVRSVHEDYIHAGADVITTNTFSSARHVLEIAGLGDQVRELNFRAVALAREARDNASHGRPVYIAGSISTFDPGLDKRKRPTPTVAQANYREQTELLAEAGVDLIATEMMRDIEQSTYAVSAAVATGLPVWIGFSCQLGEDASVQLLSGESFAAALDAILPLGAAVVNVMHTPAEDIAPALQVVREHWPGSTGAYAHSGDFENPNWIWVNLISPEAYVAEAQKWVAMGTQLIGGCCGIGPEYIRRLKEQLPTHIPPPKQMES